MTLDEKSKIPLFVAISAVPVLIVAGLWVGTLNGRVSASEQRTDRVVDKIHTMELKEDKVFEVMSDIRERLARIEEKLKR